MTHFWRNRTGFAGAGVELCMWLCALVAALTAINWLLVLAIKTLEATA